MVEIIDDKLVYKNATGRKSTRKICDDMVIIFKEDIHYDQFKWLK